MTGAAVQSSHFLAPGNPREWGPVVQKWSRLADIPSCKSMVVPARDIGRECPMF